MSFFNLLSQCISSNLSVLIFSGFCTNCGIYLKAKLLSDNGESVCRGCLAKGKCKQCGRHLDAKCMHDRHNCNNCVRKQAWRKQTGGKRRDFKNVFTEVSIAENTGEADLIVHLQRQRQRIADQLRAALGVFKYAQHFIQANFIHVLFMDWCCCCTILPFSSLDR